MKLKMFPSSVLAMLTLATPSCRKTDGPQLPPEPAKPIVLSADYAAKTLSNRSFALDLFKATVADSGGENLFISPYSVNTAFNMAWNGTAGGTAVETGEVLGNGGYTKEQINDYFKTLTDALLTIDPTTELKIANSIWADNSTPFKPSFVQVNATWYNAEVKNVDFSQQAARDAIDRWCRDNTAGKIDRISDGMTPDTKFALINAVYFKAKWRQKFDAALTRSETFTDSNGTKAMVQMMNLKDEFLYSDDDKDWKMLRLPYGNYAFDMVIMMPYTADQPLDSVIPTLTADKFYDLFRSTNRYSVTVKLPKFKAEYSYALQEKILPSMGMHLIFDPSRADLSGMCDAPMFVNRVIHKTYIDVYEEGTEAAAVTSISGVTSSPGPGTPINFFVDRPFIYSIVETSTGTILFMGRMNGF